MQTVSATLALAGTALLSCQALQVGAACTVPAAALLTAIPAASAFFDPSLWTEESTRRGFAGAKVACTTNQIKIPTGMTTRLVKSTTGYYEIVLNSKYETGICGQNLGALEKVLDPPDDVQKILGMTFGATWGITTMAKSDNEACKALEPLGNSRYIAVQMSSGMKDSLAGKVITGAAARERQQQRSGRTPPSRLQRFANGLDLLEKVLPICMAIRPCGADEDGTTFGKALTFGVYSTPGIIVIPASPATAGFELTINGLAFSSTGQLKLFTFEPSLHTDKKALGMHMWIKGAISFPITRKKSGAREQIATVEVSGQFGLYGQVGGKSNIAEFLSGVMGCNNDVEGMLSNLRSMGATGKFQIFGQLDLSIKFDMAKLVGCCGSAFEIKGTGAVLQEFAWDVNNKANTYISFYASRKAHIDTGLLLAPYGKFGEFLGKMMPKFAVTFRNFFQVSMKPMLSFGFDFAVEMSIDCGVLNDLAGAIKSVKLPGAPWSGEDLYNFIWPKAVQQFCAKTIKQSLRMSLAWKGLGLDRAGTFIQLDGVVKYKLSMSQLPICPPGGWVGDSCSKNTDCKSGDSLSGYGTKGSGYCLNSAKWNAAVFCQGKCIKLLAAGASCTGSSLNIPIWQKADVTSAEDNACEGGKCLCGKCAGKSGKLPNNVKCATNANCESGWCEGVATVGCKGTCKPKRKTGIACYPKPLTSGDGNSCVDGQCTCGTCGKNQGSGKKCSLDDNCAGSLGCGSSVQNCWGCRCSCSARRRRTVIPGIPGIRM